MALGHFSLWHLANFRCGTWHRFWGRITIETFHETSLQSYRYL